jgi:hypothetical protein
MEGCHICVHRIDGGHGVSHNEERLMAVEWTLLMDTACIRMSRDAVRRANNKSSQHNASDGQRGYNDNGRIVVPQDNIGGKPGQEACQDDCGRGRRFGDGEQRCCVLLAAPQRDIGLSLPGQYARVDFNHANGKL